MTDTVEQFFFFLMFYLFPPSILSFCITPKYLFYITSVLVFFKYNITYLRWWIYYGNESSRKWWPSSITIVYPNTKITGEFFLCLFSPRIKYRWLAYSILCEPLEWKTRFVFCAEQIQRSDVTRHTLVLPRPRSVHDISVLLFQF